MAYKQVTREQLEEYIAKNPGGSFRVNGQEMQSPYQDEDKGFLMNLLTTLSKPFRTVGGSAYSAITGEEKDNPFLTQREEVEYAKDPALFGTKQAIGLGSYLMPVGAAKGLTGGRAVGSAALRGITPGAMGGLAYSEEGKELESVLTGGITGGLIGGALQGVGEVARGIKNIKTKELGTDIRGKAIGLDANKLASKRGINVKSATQGKQVIDDWFNSMDELGLPTNTSELASSSSDQALAIYGKDFNDILARADDTIGLNGQNTKQIIDNINKSFKNNPSVLKSPIYQELTGDLLDLGNAYKPSQLNAIREKAREMINFTSAQKGMGNSQRAASEFFDVVDDFFKSTVPESAQTLSKMKNIYTVRPTFQLRAPTSGTIPVGTASTHIELPSGALQERIPEAIGRGLQGLPQGQSAQMPQLLQNIIKSGQRSIPVITGLTAGEGMQPQTQMTQGLSQQQEIGSQGINPLNLMLAQEVLNGNISATEANAVLSLLGMGGTGGQKLTEKQKLFKSAGQTAGEALAMLESGQAKTGKIQGVSTAIGKFFGTQGAGQTDYLAKLDGARMAAISALSGANVPPSEYERMRNLIPEPNDEYNIAIQKLRAFQQVMDTYAQSYGGTDTTSDTTNILQSLGIQ